MAREDLKDEATKLSDSMADTDAAKFFESVYSDCAEVSRNDRAFNFSSAEAERDRIITRLDLRVYLSHSGSFELGNMTQVLCDNILNIA